MAGRNFFTDYPAEYAAYRCHYMIPGLPRIDTIFYEPNTHTLYLTKAEKNNGDTQLACHPVTGHYEKINDFRLQSKSIFWLTPADIPHLALGTKAPEPQTLENQIKNENLLIRVKNPHDGKYDLFFFYGLFDTNAFGFSATAELSMSQGDIIARMLQRSIAQSYDEYAEIQAFKARFRGNRSDMNTKLEHQRNMNRDQKLKLEQNIMKTCDHYLSKHGSKYRRSFYFGECALDRLKNYDRPHHHLNEIIRHAVETAVDLSEPGKDVVITDSYINLSIIKSDTSMVNNVGTNDYKSEFDYLEQLEASAQRVKQKGNKVILRHVATSLDKPVSIPAISDFISRHGVNIKNVLNQNPDKWTIIRNEFMPIKKFIEPIVQDPPPTRRTA